MNELRDRALKLLRAQREDNLSRLREFVSIASVSTEPERDAEVRRAAAWLAGLLGRLGALQVQTLEPVGSQSVAAKTPGPEAERPERAGHPVVYAQTARPSPNSPRVLVYGHYDVQPVDPLELWESDPFIPVLRGEHLVARGASDMKGQIMAVVAAVEALLRAGGTGVQLKFMFEGEEEVGSPHLLELIRRHKDLLEADVCLNPDAGMLGPDLPTITYGLRGLAYFELRLRGPERDLHSGAFGGVVHNPAQALCELLAGMHDQHGRVTLPGFYDSVLPLEAEERREMARLPTDESFYLENAGVPALWGEEGFSPAERVGARPTLEVNGLLSGFTGKGSKTVLPAAAMAKLSTRLVPEQNPEVVESQLRAYLDARVPRGIRWELDRLAGGPASLSDRGSPAVRSLSRAMETVWGKAPLFRREGGSVPVTAHLLELLGMQSVLTGFALPGDNAHSPNERLHLPTWERGCETILHFLCNMSQDLTDGHAPSGS